MALIPREEEKGGDGRRPPPFEPAAPPMQAFAPHGAVVICTPDNTCLAQ